MVPLGASVPACVSSCLPSYSYDSGPALPPRVRTHVYARAYVPRTTPSSGAVPSLAAGGPPPLLPAPTAPMRSPAPAPRSTSCPVAMGRGSRHPPVVQDTVDHHPLRLDAVAVEALLHLGVERVLVLPFLALAVLIAGAVVKGRRLVHVVLSLVVAIHHRVVELQLLAHRQRLRGAGGRGSPVSLMQLPQPGSRAGQPHRQPPAPRLPTTARTQC